MSNHDSGPSGRQLFFASTTINGSTPALEKNIRCWEDASRCYIAYDRKTPVNQSSCTEAHWIAFDAVPDCHYQRLCPWDSYARKNIAFIAAAKAGAHYIFETDDDNELTVSFNELAAKTELFDRTVSSLCGGGVVNLFAEIYEEVQDNIWARGFPLRYIETQRPRAQETSNGKPGVIQLLVDGNPDVDAIFRLVRGAHLDFRANDKILPLAIADLYHPFNSQATLWPKKMFSLMYLPATCSFRMTDIWRGYIAQRILYETGHCVVFESPAVRQVRNAHLSYEDFMDEHGGYLQSDEVIETLKELSLSNQLNVEDMLRSCYTRLCQVGIFDKKELVLLDAWCEAIQ